MSEERWPKGSKELSAGFPHSHKRKSHSCFVHPSHQVNNLLIKLDSVWGSRATMSCILPMSFICICIRGASLVKIVLISEMSVSYLISTNCSYLECHSVNAVWKDAVPASTSLITHMKVCCRPLWNIFTIKQQNKWNNLFKKPRSSSLQELKGWKIHTLRLDCVCAGLIAPVYQSYVRNFNDILTT